MAREPAKNGSQNQQRHFDIDELGVEKDRVDEQHNDQSTETNKNPLPLCQLVCLTRTPPSWPVGHAHCRRRYQCLPAQ